MKAVFRAKSKKVGGDDGRTEVRTYPQLICSTYIKKKIRERKTTTTLAIFGGGRE